MNEAYLIRAVQRGDERAFTEMFNTYKLPVYYFILRRIRNETDAEDLTRVWSFWNPADTIQ